MPTDQDGRARAAVGEADERARLILTNSKLCSQVVILYFVFYLSSVAPG